MADERSLEDLRRDADKARADLVQTVDELRARASPTGLMNAAARSARDNPLQTVALAAGLAYPLLKTVRSIPAPLLMIGAGLFLSSTSAGQSASRKAVAFGSDMTNKVGALASDMSKTAAERANAGLAAARDTAAAAGATLSNKMSAVKEKASSLAAASADQLQRVGAATAAAQSDLASRAASAADGFSPQASKDQLARLVEEAGAAAAETIRRNPLLVGGVGAAIGAVIAGLLPSSKTEDRWVGRVSDHLKSGARETASQGYEAARDAAAAAYDSAAERAGEEGLDADGVKAAAEDFAERARKVANSALDAAAQAEKTH
ncbi:MAG TPA: DUF3618 domain-containing protein [Roseiarcus sp.]|nr:DUF3618 domain-containing protein [Roseiarcus sp.]